MISSIFEADMIFVEPEIQFFVEKPEKPQKNERTSS